MEEEKVDEQSSNLDSLDTFAAPVTPVEDGNEVQNGEEENPDSSQTASASEVVSAPPQQEQEEDGDVQNFTQAVRNQSTFVSEPEVKKKRKREQVIVQQQPLHKKMVLTDPKSRGTQVKDEKEVPSRAELLEWRYKNLHASLMEACNSCASCGSITTFPVRSKQCPHPICLFCLHELQQNATTAKNYIEQTCKICGQAYPSGRGNPHPQNSVAMCTLFEPAYLSPCEQDRYLYWLESLYERDANLKTMKMNSSLLTDTKGEKEAALRVQMRQAYETSYSFVNATRDLLDSMKSCLYPCEGIFFSWGLTL